MQAQYDQLLPPEPAWTNITQMPVRQLRSGVPQMNGFLASLPFIAAQPVAILHKHEWEECLLGGRTVHDSISRSQHTD